MRNGLFKYLEVANRSNRSDHISVFKNFIFVFLFNKLIKSQIEGTLKVLAILFRRTN